MAGGDHGGAVRAAADKTTSRVFSRATGRTVSRVLSKAGLAIVGRAGQGKVGGGTEARTAGTGAIEAARVRSRPKIENGFTARWLIVPWSERPVRMNSLMSSKPRCVRGWSNSVTNREHTPSSTDRSSTTFERRWSS